MSNVYLEKDRFEFEEGKFELQAHIRDGDLCIALWRRAENGTSNLESTVYIDLQDLYTSASAARVRGEANAEKA